MALHTQQKALACFGSNPTSSAGCTAGGARHTTYSAGSSVHSPSHNTLPAAPAVNGAITFSTLTALKTLLVNCTTKRNSMLLQQASVSSDLVSVLCAVYAMSLC